MAKYTNTSLAQQVKSFVARMPPGQIFGYTDIPDYKEAPGAVAKSLSRMAKNRLVKRLSKGRYYVPVKGILGERPPMDSAVLKDSLYKNGKQRAYVTGLALFNSWGLTTQVPYEISVATMGAPRKKTMGKLRIKFVRASAPIEPRDVELLQYLDVLKALNKIPDTDIDTSAQRMCEKLFAFSSAKRARLQRLAVKFYPPRVKAMLGLFLSNANLPVDKQIKEAINLTTQFELGLGDNRWPEKANWQIK